MFKLLSIFFTIWFIHTVKSVFPPFIIGAIFAYLLLPLVNHLSLSAKINRRQAVAIIYISLLTIIVIVGYLFVPHVAEQFGGLVSHRTELVTNLVAETAKSFNWKIDVAETSNQILGSLEQNAGRPSEIVHLGGVLSHGFLSVLVCIVSSIYFMVDSKRVGGFALRFVPEEKHATCITLSDQMNQMLSRYVRGQLVLIVVMSTVAWVFLHFVIHMKYALVIALLCGFLEIIPVLGPILATTTATLVGMSQYGVGVALGIIGFYTIARWMEDYLVVPKVIGHAVDLHPLIVIFAVLCGDVLAGALGMLIAIPVAASIKVIIDFTHPPKLEPKLESKPEP